MWEGNLGFGEQGPACLQAAVLNRNHKGTRKKHATNQHHKPPGPCSGAAKQPCFPSRDFLLQGNPWLGGAGPFLLAAASGHSVVEQVLAQAWVGAGWELAWEGAPSHRKDSGGPATWVWGGVLHQLRGLGLLSFLFVQRTLCKNSSWETGSPACQVQHRE